MNEALNEGKEEETAFAKHLGFTPPEPDEPDEKAVEPAPAPEPVTQPLTAEEHPETWHQVWDDYPKGDKQ